MNSTIFKRIGVAALAAAIFLAGTYVGKETGVSASAKAADIEAQADLAPYWKAWNVLNEKFVSSKNELPSDEKKVWSSIEGLAASYGDPYTVFLPPDENERFENDIAGNFEGVGMEISMKDDALTVVAPLKGSPAEKAGVQPGDKVVKIDDKTATGLSVDEAVKLIRGKQGTTVTVTFFRPATGETLVKPIVRAVIDMPTIDTELKDAASVASTTGQSNTGLKRDGVYVIKLYGFTATSPNLFREALRGFIESGSHKLILDLRGNPGGYLEAAVDMASFFLPAGKVVVKEDFGAGKEGKSYRSKGYDVFNDNLRMAILVNGGSASASEILAGALQEHGVAKLVGTSTFGKGSVQELVEITPETSLKVTIARWLTPGGISISEGGLTPDIKVENVAEDVKAGKDAQLEKAIEILNAKTR